MKRALFKTHYEIDDSANYTEAGSDNGAKLYLDAIEDDEVRAYLQRAEQMDFRHVMMWLSEMEGSENVMTTPFTTRSPEAMRYRLQGRTPKLLFVTRPMHTVERLDEFLYAISEGVPTGTLVWLHSMTSVLQKKVVQKSYPKLVAQMVTLWNYVWHRVFPKLKMTNRLYFAVTKGKSRMMNRVELIGRIYRAGFEVVDEKFRDGEFFALAMKVTDPVDDEAPTGSPLIHLRRIGKDGKEITVHKLRTMYTYSEYVQPYIYHYQSLERGGKFKDDYRINFWGRMLRRTWIDELPMLWNLVRGDIKLVGVRPLSRHYFEIYSPELQQLRIRTKPGLLPPFYYEKQTPQTVEDVEASERRYLEAYLEHPFRTDWRYFWGIVGNIIFRHRHSS